MDKGWGLTLNNSDPIGFFNLTPTLNNSKDSMFSGTHFPVNLSYKEEKVASSPLDENRVAMGELDLFSNKPRDDIDSKISSIVVKKENSHGETTPRNYFDVNTGLHLLTANTGSEQSTVVDYRISSNKEDKGSKNELTLLQVELERMNSENQRLREMLTQVSNNYSSLQMQILSIMQQQNSTRTSESTREHANVKEESEDKKHEVGRLFVPRQFMDLGPSTTPGIDEPSHTSSEERTLSGPPTNTVELSNSSNRNEIVRPNKRIGREDSPESESWVPNKVPKLIAPKTVDQTQESILRKARVSVRARSEAPMIADGCQWRKYGQKMAKGNPCPRAYYRCTMAIGCPVRKQVQRCVEDRTILITSYEGNHNHPLPPAAVAMASTTSAAANMLLSGSATSADGLMNPNFLAKTILPCSSSIATISASAPFPTITLDLTHSPNQSQFQRPPTQFQFPFSGPTQNFASAPLLGQPLYNQSKFSGLQLSQSTQLAQAPPPCPSFADTLSVATAAITSDPNFTAALAAAITSIMGGTLSNNNNNDDINNHRTDGFTGN